MLITWVEKIGTWRGVYYIDRDVDAILLFHCAVLVWSYVRAPGGAIFERYCYHGSKTENRAIFIGHCLLICSCTLFQLLVAEDDC